MADVLNDADFVLFQADLLKELALAQAIYLADAVVNQLEFPQVQEEFQGIIQARDLPMVKAEILHVLLPLAAHHHHVGGGLLGGIRLAVTASRGQAINS